MKRILINLTESEHERLSNESRTRGYSISSIVRGRIFPETKSKSIQERIEELEWEDFYGRTMDDLYDEVTSMQRIIDADEIPCGIMEMLRIRKKKAKDEIRRKAKEIEEEENI
jgi:hypothetical protein